MYAVHQDSSPMKVNISIKHICKGVNLRHIGVMDSLPHVSGSSHETAAVLLPGFAINW